MSAAAVSSTMGRVWAPHPPSKSLYHHWPLALNERTDKRRGIVLFMCTGFWGSMMWTPRYSGMLPGWRICYQPKKQVDLPTDPVWPDEPGHSRLRSPHRFISVGGAVRQV